MRCLTLPGCPAWFPSVAICCHATTRSWHRGDIRPRQDAQHAAQRFGRAPQQLVADGEGAHVLAAPSPACGCGPREWSSCRSPPPASGPGWWPRGCWHHLHPGVVGGDHRLDVGHRHVLLELEGQRLAVAAHRAHAHAEAVDRHRRRAETFALAEDLVGLGHALPLFLGHAIAQVLVDPRDQRAAQRHAEVGRLGGRQAALGGDHLAVDLQDGALGVVQQRLDRGVQRAVLRQQFAHVLRAAARGRLVGLGAHPLDQAGLVERAHAHQHAADGAVAADPVAPAIGQRVLDHRHVHRVEDDHRVVAMRSVDAASIQWPFQPAARSLG